MNRRQQFLTQIMGAMALVALLGATPAAAQSQIYAGSNCQPASEVRTDTNLGREAGSALSNAGNPNQVVFCPVLRDLVLSTNGFAADVLVQGFVTCSIASLGEDGIEVIEGVAAEPDPNGGALQELRLEVTQSVAQGPYILRCRMNNATEIRKYTITENP